MIQNYRDRELLNLLKLCEHYQTDGVYIGWLGRKSTNQREKTPLRAHIEYPDIDFCIRAKVWISYSPTEHQVYVCDWLKLGQNHWLNTFIDDVKNSRIDISKYYMINLQPAD